jgi:hypothetical protein
LQQTSTKSVASITESSLPGGAGETLYVTEIEDTANGKTGKGTGWTRDKADSKAWDDLKRK